MRCVKTAERMEVLFGMEIFEEQKQIALDGGPYSFAAMGGE